MSTMSARRKAMRGTKRTCQACEVRFYDLARNPILCPMCGAHYAPPPEPIVQARERSAPFSSKTGWRSHPLGRTQPVVPVADVTPIDPSDSLAVGNEAEETASELSEDRGVVLEQEPDDGDVSALLTTMRRHRGPMLADARMPLPRSWT
jgi:uncharacterized protein (TIGR02300 family)